MQLNLVAKLKKAAPLRNKSFSYIVHDDAEIVASKLELIK